MNNGVLQNKNVPVIQNRGTNLESFAPVESFTGSLLMDPGKINHRNAPRTSKNNDQMQFK